MTNTMEQELHNVLKVLREGGTILYPTDTIWGIGCDATNEKAVEKVIRIKATPALKGGMQGKISVGKDYDMFYKAHPLIFEKAKELRGKPTPAEDLLWNYVGQGQLGVKFRRQHPASMYVLDFYAHAVNLAIEIDGSIHAEEEVKRNDIERQNRLESLGIKFIRFTNQEVLSQIEEVLKKINTEIKKLKQEASSSLQGGEPALAPFSPSRSASAERGRAGGKSFIVLVSDPGMLNRFVKNVPELAWDLMDASNTAEDPEAKPLTIIYDCARGLAKNVVAEDGSIGVRLVTREANEFCHRMIHKFGRPIVSTSANLSGMPAPKNFSEISNEIISGIDYVVNWRQNDYSNSQASSIIRLKENGEFKIVRE